MTPCANNGSHDHVCGCDQKRDPRQDSKAWDLCHECGVGSVCTCLNSQNAGYVRYPSPKIVSPASKATTTNPKDLLGSKKVALSKFPPAALIHGSMAMMVGGNRYGWWNWRAKKVVASIYIDAMMRHLLAWADGETTAEDSGVHHLGHAIACCAILLDAEATGNLIDDRGITEASYGKNIELMHDMEAVIAKYRPEWARTKPEPQP